MKVGIIGLGLIGGSIAIDLRKREFTDYIIGVDTNKKHAKAALNERIVDIVTDIDYAIKNTDIIVVATPVNAASKIISYILDNSNRIIVTDVCSTKEKLVESVKNHKNRKNYVAAHPMAGKEFSGPKAAISGLFDGKVTIFCDSHENNSLSLEKIKLLFRCLNMKIIYMDSSSHDRHAAYISHISHISSFALALTVLEKEKNEKHIFDLASGGLYSTVRLAKSNASMWVPIFEHNRANIIEAIDTYINNIIEFKECIESCNLKGLCNKIKESNNIKRVLPLKGYSTY